MVNVTPTWLSGRSFPRDAPHGKGLQVEAQEGEVASSLVPLLGVVQAYREACPVQLAPLSTVDSMSVYQPSRPMSLRSVAAGGGGSSLGGAGDDGDGGSGVPARSALSVIKRTLSRMVTSMEGRGGGRRRPQSTSGAAAATAGNGSGKSLGSPTAGKVADDGTHAGFSRRHFLKAQQESLIKRAKEATGPGTGMPGGLVNFQRATWDATSAGIEVPASELTGGPRPPSGTVFQPRSM